MVVLCRLLVGYMSGASLVVNMASNSRQNIGFFLRVCVRGRGIKSEFSLLVGDLVVIEWKFDGGTTAPPFPVVCYLDSVKISEMFGR